MKLILTGGLLMAFLTACGPTPEVKSDVEADEVSEKQPATEEKENVEFKEIEKDERFTYYEGDVTVSGRYEYYANAPFLGDQLCFYPDEATKNLIPRVDGDDRDVWFCFWKEDQENSLKLFGIDAKAVLRNSNIESVSGKATIRISNYVVDGMQSEVFDTAKLKAVISNEAPVENLTVEATKDQL